MNTHTTVERIQAIDAVPTPGSMPAGMWSAEDLLARIDERSTPMTELRNDPDTKSPPGADRWRGPAIAVGIAAAALVIVGAIGMLTLPGTDDSPPAGPATPPTGADALAVVDEYLNRYEAGDAAFLTLFAPDTPYFEALDTDLALRESRYFATTGMRADRDCVAEGTAVTCTWSVTSGLNAGWEYPPRSGTFTVEGGRIASIETDDDLSPIHLDRFAFEEYRQWVEANHPDKYDDLIPFGASLATYDAEIRRLQQGMIDQYHEATGRT